MMSRRIEVRRPGAHQLERGLAVGRRLDVEAVVDEHVLQQLHVGRRVVDDEDPPGHGVGIVHGFDAAVRDHGRSTASRRSEELGQLPNVNGFRHVGVEARREDARAVRVHHRRGDREDRECGRAVASAQRCQHAKPLMPGQLDVEQRRIGRALARSPPGRARPIPTATTSKPWKPRTSASSRRLFSSSSTTRMRLAMVGVRRLPGEPHDEARAAPEVALHARSRRRAARPAGA